MNVQCICPHSGLIYTEVCRAALCMGGAQNLENKLLNWRSCCEQCHLEMQLCQTNIM